MKKAKSNKTIEGNREAINWLENHRSELPKLRSIFRQYYQHNGRDLPWRRTKDPYKMLVAEQFLQKTGTASVEKVWGTFTKHYPNVPSLAVASIRNLEAIVKPLGILKRTRLLREAARIIKKRGGEIIGDFDFLTSLPGVGDYTASAVLSFAFNIQAATIDVNAARVYTRIGGFSPNTLRQGLEFARTIGKEVISQKTHKEVNYGVLDLAAQVCKIIPFCRMCPATRLCSYAEAHSVIPPEVRRLCDPPNLTW